MLINGHSESVAARDRSEFCTSVIWLSFNADTLLSGTNLTDQTATSLTRNKTSHHVSDQLRVQARSPNLILFAAA